MQTITEADALAAFKQGRRVVRGQFIHQKKSSGIGKKSGKPWNRLNTICLVNGESLEWEQFIGDEQEEKQNTIAAPPMTPVLLEWTLRSEQNGGLSLAAQVMVIKG